MPIPVTPAAKLGAELPTPDTRQQQSPPMPPQATPDCGVLDQSSWEEAYRIYKSNIIQVVSPRWAVLSWAYRLFGISPPIPEHCGFRISIAEMQRMHMTALQCQLIDSGIQLQWPTDLAGTLNRLTAVLEKYTQAIRDYDYMVAASQKPLDAFVISAERALERDLIWDRTRRVNKSILDMFRKNPRRQGQTPQNADQKTPSDITHTGPWEQPSQDGKVDPTGGTRSANAKNLAQQAFWSRLIAAIVGAVFLVGPMWLLALKRETFVHLGATTAFVFAFGFVLAFFVEKTDQVFAGTLAYAAVLMVFVGIVMEGNA